MFEELDAKLDQAKQQVATEQELRASLPARREDLLREAYQLQDLENALAEINREIHKLDSLSLAGLMCAISGQKQLKLAEKREEAATLQDEYDEHVTKVTSLEQELRTIEHALAESEDAQQDYQSLCAEKERLIIDKGGDEADHLSDLAARIEQAKAEQKKVKKAVQTGEHLLERLFSMTRAAGRARGKGVASIQVGAIAATTVNAVTSQGARGSVNRAADGLDRFGQCLLDLDLTAGTHIDLELTRIGATLNEFRGDLSVTGAVCKSSAAAPAVEAVQEAIGFAEEKSREITQQIAEMEDERRAFIERV